MEELKIGTMGTQDIKVMGVIGFKGPTIIKINKEMTRMTL